MADSGVRFSDPIQQARYKALVLAAVAKLLAESADPQHRSPEYIEGFFRRLEGHLEEIAGLLAGRVA
jgi:hypothetical protein